MGCVAKNILLGKANRATGWPIQTTEQMHQRGFASTGGTNNSDAFALTNIEVNVLQNIDSATIRNKAF